jgi:hypothetical protein
VSIILELPITGLVLWVNNSYCLYVKCPLLLTNVNETRVLFSQDVDLSQDTYIGNGGMVSRSFGLEVKFP